MTEEEDQQLQQQQRARPAPGWACRARALGEDLSYVVEGWSDVPKPSARALILVIGCGWTWLAGPPEFLDRLLSLLTAE